MGPYKEYRGGGISVYVRNISERLAKRHDVTVFATNPGGLPRFEVINGVTVERFKRLAPGGAYFFSLDMLLRLRRVHFDVVHGHGYQAFPLHLSTLARRKKFIASTHYHGVGHSPFRNSLMRIFRVGGKRTLESADRIVAVSEYEKSVLCRQFNLDANRIAVIPCGLDFSQFEGLERCERDFRSILYVGRLESYKGAQFLVEALPKLDSDVFLEIVGKGPMKHVLEERAKELKVFERVRFFQDLSRRQLLQMVFDADVFAMLSQYEAYSMAVAEALAAGRPCIVARTSALSEWVDDEQCFGLQYPIRISDLVELVNAILGGRKDPQQTRFLTSKILDWDEVVKRLEIVYKE